MKYSKEFDGMSREELEKLAKGYLDNLTRVQERCTELCEENRALKKRLNRYEPPIVV